MYDPEVKSHSDFVNELSLFRNPVKLLHEVKREAMWVVPHFGRASLYYEKLVLIIGAQREVHYDMSALW